MTKPRNNDHAFGQPPDDAYRGAARTKDTDLSLAAGRNAYREDYERDYGPDLDEPLDGTESGHEF